MLRKPFEQGGLPTEKVVLEDCMGQKILFQVNEVLAEPVPYKDHCEQTVGTCTAPCRYTPPILYKFP
jgi:hypothetical protein